MARCCTAFLLLAFLASLATPGLAAKRPSDAAPAPGKCGPVAKNTAAPADPDSKPAGFVPDEVWSDGTVTTGGTTIAYCAVAGTLVVRPKGWDDTQRDPPAKSETDAAPKTVPAQASMFYTAYFRRDAGATPRPIVFLFNGGPGSASVWLHMGAFGPKRVETPATRHAPPAPYKLVNNEYSLLDAADLVFIDAPGTGFSRIMGEDKEKSFYGVDEDARAFAHFIATFLSKYKRWNAPKYLFGESYGTMRAAVLANLLAVDPGIDFNGVIMLSQVLTGASFPDRPELTPGNDLPYQLALPVYAATAWYHAQPPGERDKPPPAALLHEVERFAMTEYAAALAAGGALDPAEREKIAARLSAYTGLPVDYWRRSDLRVGVDEFRQEVLREQGLIVGATDTRFSGPALDRVSRKAKYDPTDAAITSAYVSVFNDYVRRVLGYGEGKTYRPAANEIGEVWSYRHQPAGVQDVEVAADGPANVLPDLAHAMKYNPLLKVQLNAGYYDLLTPYFQGRYEMRHLPIPAALRANIEYRCHASGHLVYVAKDALARLHDNVADFIDRTSGLPPRPERPKPLGADCATAQ